MGDSAHAAAKGGTLHQVPFIIGNEACERFSFHGMRDILTPFLRVPIANATVRSPSVLERIAGTGPGRNAFLTFFFAAFAFAAAPAFAAYARRCPMQDHCRRT